jgi:hypothetical protein
LVERYRRKNVTADPEAEPPARYRRKPPDVKPVTDAAGYVWVKRGYWWNTEGEIADWQATEWPIIGGGSYWTLSAKRKADGVVKILECRSFAEAQQHVCTTEGNKFST